MVKWQFMPYGQGEMKTNPTESVFFSTTEVGNFATGLVREGIQNSLDEALDEPSEKKEKKKKTVHVRISLSGDKYALKPIEYKQYIDGLKEHLSSKLSGIRNLPDFENDKMPYLVFEDFNTKGLRGNPNESADVEIEDKSNPHNFYHFWRNVGISGKPEDKLGRWGIGKIVFPAASRINSFWGVTIQSSTNERYLLGQSILKSHNLDNNPKQWGYRPYGYYANYENPDPFPCAIESATIIEDFSKAFRLTRKDNNSGLSIIVPFYREEITVKSLLTAVILQYYFPLIKGELSVDVSYEDEIVSITNESLVEVVNSYWDDSIVPQTKTSVIALFDFIKWSIKCGAAEFHSLKEQPAKNQPKWGEKLWEDLLQDQLIEYFEKEGKIAFNVPVKYQKEGSPAPTTCWFKIFIAKDDDLKSAETHYVRGNITIIDIKSVKNPGVRAMVFIDDKDLSNLLGDSENPAHTQWQKDSPNFIDKYVHGDKCINFVINSLSNVYQKLQKPAAGIDRDILKNVFFIPNEEEGNSDDINDDDSHKDDKDPGKPNIPDLPKGKRQMIRVKKIPGGIHVYPVDLSKENLPEITLKVAYDTTRGNPLKKYKSFDFQLNRLPIKTKPKNCQFSTPEPNVIKLIPLSPDFELVITGFDENRDLFIDVKTLYPVYDTEI